MNREQRKYFTDRIDSELNKGSGFTVIGNKYENPQLLDDVLPRE